MIDIFKLLMVVLMTFSGFADAEAMKCYTKNEVGEASSGESLIFSRTDKLNKSKPAIMNFDKLVIVNATTGSLFDMTKKSENHYMAGNYHYLTNNKKTVVVEVNFSESFGSDLVYSKILMCESYQ
jgi:hypothetical protein